MVDLDYYGRRGVELLKEATPVETGLTRDSWIYRIVDGKLQFVNTNGKRVLFLTDGYQDNGVWVPGEDFVTPIVDQIRREILMEVKRDAKRRRVRRRRLLRKQEK